MGIDPSGEGPQGPASPTNPDPLVAERPRYYWEVPLSGAFDLEAVQAQLRNMSDEEVARAVLAIRMGPRGTTREDGTREKSPAQKERERGKRQSQKELLKAAKEFLAMQAAQAEQFPTQGEIAEFQAQGETDDDILPDEP